MKKITTIIFDLGGVLLNNDWHDGNRDKFEEYENIFGVTYDDMERGWDKAWPDYQLGKMSEDKFWKIFLTEAGSNNIDIKKAKELWRKYVVENESMLSLVKILKEKGYKLAALTTISREWLDFKIDKYNFNEYFDTIVSSGYSGLAKPDTEIYKMVLDNLGVDGEECVFIDDSESTLPPASELGIKTILFRNKIETEEKLQKLNSF